MIIKAKIEHLKEICYFTDWWLAGRGLKSKAPGAVNDYFISPSQHKKYIEKYTTYIKLFKGHIKAWAVVHPSGTMIHLLVAGDLRGHGIGAAMLKHANPSKVRSKSNQSTGNPSGFYEHYGFVKIDSVKSQGLLNIDKIKPNRKKIIDIFIKK